MKTLLYANRAEPKSISVISILLLATVGDITKLRCMHRECYIFASQNLWLYLRNRIYTSHLVIPYDDDTIVLVDRRSMTVRANSCVT